MLRPEEVAWEQNKKVRERSRTLPEMVAVGFSLEKLFYKTNLLASRPNTSFL